MLKLSIKDPDSLAKICHALSTPLRLNILSLLENGTLSCLELSKQLKYPLSTISANVKILEEAGLVMTELLPAKNGSKKMCSLVYLDISIQLNSGQTISQNDSKYETEIPIGNYMDFEVFPSCGFIVNEKQNFLDDNPNHFLNPARVSAQLLWFRKGYVEYRIPVEKIFLAKARELSFELEICSEAPGFNNKWKSDITMWINDVELGKWTSPADFGDRRGSLTPDFWPLGNTQYGILTNWTVNQSASLVNGEPISAVTISELHLDQYRYITMKIGVKENSKHIGGINLFGDQFGDYRQNIRMTLRY